jgi:hypothetical protein
VNFGFVSGRDFAATATPADSFSLAVSALVAPQGLQIKGLSQAAEKLQE